uniref:Orotidine 5'-phosphate decarboxylase n=1 Tax=Paulinella micropora TaxID=1928728 RepID=A0A385I166_9EUKA|nr:orotidine 5'-phosphate decarboxylase [Paulinella micropora]AXY63624.1 orotidine 5'-phosphate decarboxylase [Paulinella micropora]
MPQPQLSKISNEDSVSWASERIIVALDGMNESDALNFVSTIPALRWVKVGCELFTIAGPHIVQKLRKKGLRVFLDLKFHDIPTTMAGACKSAAQLGAELITVHASAGSEALKSAQDGAIVGATMADLPQPTLLAVTVLTSWDTDSFAKQLAIQEPVADYVDRLARLAVLAKIGGCVCSPFEVGRLRCIYPEPFRLVTPGVRLDFSPVNDQQRVRTPSQALQSGASQIVIGRPITTSLNPKQTFLEYCQALTC